MTDLNAQDVDRLHVHSDKDSSVIAQHHTLGSRRTQASPGDHTHDGKTSRKINEKNTLNLVLTGYKDHASPFIFLSNDQLEVTLNSLIEMLKKVIEFTDNRTEAN